MEKETNLVERVKEGTSSDIRLYWHPTQASISTITKPRHAPSHPHSNPSPPEQALLSRSIYDARSSTYDTEPTSIHPHQALSFITALAPQPGQQVLDLATGTGLVALLAKRGVGPSGVVVGVDISEGMLSVGRQKALRDGLDVPAEDAMLVGSALQSVRKGLGLPFDRSWVQSRESLSELLVRAGLVVERCCQCEGYGKGATVLGGQLGGESAGSVFDRVVEAPMFRRFAEDGARGRAREMFVEEYEKLVGDAGGNTVGNDCFYVAIARKE